MNKEIDAHPKNVAGYVALQRKAGVFSQADEAKHARIDTEITRI